MPSSDNSFTDDVCAEVALAIGEVLRKHSGGLIEAFVGIVDYVTPDGEHGFTIFADPDQLHIRTVSLTHYLYHRELEIQRINIHDNLVDSDPDND